MTSRKTFGSRPSWREMLLQHLIVFLICVVFPGATTLMAPVTWLTFHRSDQTVQCSTWTCMYFIVPFKIQRVDSVVAIESRKRAGGSKKEMKNGRSTGGVIHVDGEGFLQIHGEGERVVEVSVSPASLESVVKKANDFLSSDQQGTTTIFAIANWKFGGLMGGILSLFTLLYVVSYTLELLKVILRASKSFIFDSPKSQSNLRSD